MFQKARTEIIANKTKHIRQNYLNFKKLYKYNNLYKLHKVQYINKVQYNYIHIEYILEFRSNRKIT